MAAFVRSTKAALTLQCLIQSQVPRRWKWVYSKKEGVPRHILEWLHMEIDLSPKNISFILDKNKWKALKEDHKFITERHSILGPDLATAHFMVKRGAKVKFVGRDQWFKQDKDGHMYLPNRFIPNMLLEAIDASGMEMSYVAFDNMIDLKELRYLNFSGCQNFSDWCMARLYQFQDTLEFLDISECNEVTENGLACLHHMRKLRGLKLSSLPNVKDIGLMVLLLEDMIPDCTVFGIEPHLLLPKSDAGSISPETDPALRSNTLSTEAVGVEDSQGFLHSGTKT